MTALLVELARVNIRLDHIAERFTAIEERQKKIQEEIDSIHDAANRWKGGFLVVLSIGTALGWLASFGGNISKIWGH